MGCDWPVVVLCGFSARSGYTELGFGMCEDGTLLIARSCNPTMFYAVVQFVNTVEAAYYDHFGTRAF